MRTSDRGQRRVKERKHQARRVKDVRGDLWMDKRDQGKMRHNSFEGLYSNSLRDNDKGREIMKPGDRRRALDAE